MANCSTATAASPRASFPSDDADADLASRQKREHLAARPGLGVCFHSRATSLWTLAARRNRLSRSGAVYGTGEARDTAVVARYDGLADWYEDYISGTAAQFTAEAGGALTRLLGRGVGRCLDVGCGTGVYIAQAADLGWSLTGVDISEDQLRVARQRLGDQADLLCADAGRLPFASYSFDAVYATMIHTDVPDIAVVFAEMARVLASDGRFVYVGTHPCFVAPFIAGQLDRTTVIHPGYAKASRYDDGPGIGDGIRARVGAYHHPLGALIGALPAAGLRIDSIEELYGDPPRLLALGACRVDTAAT
jgi:SAM-dependent methyltransferase